jgi:hypothetical protein
MAAIAPPLSDEVARREAPTLAAGLLRSLPDPKGYVAMAAPHLGFTFSDPVRSGR